MKKLIFLFTAAFLSVGLNAQNCEKGCAKITKTEPTTLKGIKPDRALLVFKFLGPNNKPAKTLIKIVVDKDTVYPVVDKNGITKITSKAGPHKLKFKGPYWYTVKTNVTLKEKLTYYINVKFEAAEMIGGKREKDDD